MPKILLIEDEEDMRFILTDNLETEGYEVETAATGSDGLRMALSGKYQLLVLDIMLPEIDGIEICKRLRKQDPLTPVIMLTAKGDEIDKVVGLEVGADDYITKPFGMREFLARVKAALRRARHPEPDQPRSCRIGPWTVQFDSRELLRNDGIREVLTTHENALLQLLAQHRGNPIDRDEILAQVWNLPPSARNRNVDNYVARLRAKIEDLPAHPKHLITVHGTGYKLV